MMAPLEIVFCNIFQKMAMTLNCVWSESILSAVWVQNYSDIDLRVLPVCQAHVE